MDIKMVNENEFEEWVEGNNTGLFEVYNNDEFEIIESEEDLIKLINDLSLVRDGIKSYFKDLRYDNINIFFNNGENFLVNYF